MVDSFFVELHIFSLAYDQIAMKQDMTMPKCCMLTG